MAWSSLSCSPLTTKSNPLLSSTKQGSFCFEQSLLFKKKISRYHLRFTLCSLCSRRSTLWYLPGLKLFNHINEESGKKYETLNFKEVVRILKYINSSAHFWTGTKGFITSSLEEKFYEQKLGGRLDLTTPNLKQLFDTLPEVFQIPRWKSNLKC